MTTPQRIALHSTWWPKAARAKGWNTGDRDRKLEALSAAVGRTLQSSSDLNSTTDIDAVKAHLGMLADNVAATVETDHPELGEARRLKWQINQLAGQLGGRLYVQRIAHDKFAGSDIDSLTIPQLTQLRNTLNARAHARRKTRAAATSPKPDRVETPF